MATTLDQVQALYEAEGGVEVGIKIDIFKNKRWLKCHRGLILAGWEENDGQVENFRAVVKKANVEAPAPVAPLELDYHQVGAMTAVGATIYGPAGGAAFGLGAAIGELLFSGGKK